MATLRALGRGPGDRRAAGGSDSPRALLRGDDAGTLSNQYLWITTAAQMGMGFILPFALTFVAIPLETFVHSLRTVVGLSAIAVLRLVSLLLRLSGNACHHLGRLAEQLYDLPLFIPLWLQARNPPSSGGQRQSSLREART